jgi:acyl dehydratase
MDFDVPVERGHVLQFARAIGAPDAPPDAVPSVPPTFVVVADHFDPHFDRRPTIGQPWIGSGRTASGVADDDPAHHSLFHVEQRFTYARALRVGEVLRAHRLPPRTWTKQGRRAGRLQFVELVTELRDPDGALVVTNTWLDVATERTHNEVTVAQPDDHTGGADGPVDGIVIADRITRTQIVMYAGASGDFHPLHHDDVYARHRGYPGSFVPGMLTMAIAGRAVATVLDTDQLAEFGGRFHAQVWPGDTLLATLHTTDRDITDPDTSGATAVDVTLRTHRDVVVFTGDARTRHPDAQGGNNRSSSAASVASSTG